MNSSNSKISARGMSPRGLFIIISGTGNIYLYGYSTALMEQK